MLPSLFISHGSPMLALEPGASGPALKRLAAELPRPKAIVLVSAHWESPDLRVASHPAPEIWHDFAGFPPSKAYSGLKVARRSHSKRNIPHIECHIIRCVGKNKTQFARWSTDDRVWLIL